MRDKDEEKEKSRINRTQKNSVMRKGRGGEKEEGVKEEGVDHVDGATVGQTSRVWTRSILSDSYSYFIYSVLLCAI